MNMKDQEHIRTLRTAGCSYQQIANVLNMKKTTVKNHCLRHGINLPEGVEPKSASISPTGGWKLCLECHELFTMSCNLEQKFCSDKCRNRHWSRTKGRKLALEKELKALQKHKEELDFLARKSDELYNDKPFAIGCRRLTEAELKEYDKE